MASAAEDFVLLGLRLGRHVDGLVDSYCGPAGLSEQVDAKPLVGPAALVEQADALVAGLEDGWLRDQARGLRTYAGVLAGEGLSYADEVEGCYGVRPEPVDTDVYEAAHAQLDELLPGSGPLGDRYVAWRRSRTVPDSRVVPAARSVVDVLRTAVVSLVDLPAGEGAVLEEVRDEPWRAFNYYLGGLRSRVAINLDVPATFDDVVELAAHEVYPGHHTEHSLKERLFVLDRGEIEESIQLVPTPAALVSEGIAEAGPAFVLGPEVNERLDSALREFGFEGDVAHGRAVREARRPLRRVGLDAALMVHEEGASAEEARDHVVRWALVTPEEAEHSVRFVTDPTWRAYVITYSTGYQLCHAWVEGDPARFARLLTEHVRVSELLPPVSSTP